MMLETTTEGVAAVESRLRLEGLRKRLPPPAMRRVIRKGRGLSAANVALYCGVSRQIVGAWERGERNPSGPRLERYAELLDRLVQGEPS